MMDLPSQAVLQNVFRRASRSLMQYVQEAFPWVSDEERGVLAQVEELIAEERHAIARLADFLRRQRIPLPYVGSYPSHFTTINYVALDRLLPMLADHQRVAVKELERDLAHTTDPEARAEVESLLTMSRRHQGELDRLSAVNAQAAVR